MQSIPPIPDAVLAKAQDMGLDDVLLDAVRRRLLAGVMDKLAKMLGETAKAIKGQVSPSLLGYYVVLDMGDRLDLPGWCTIAKKGHVSTKMDKKKAAAYLLSKGVAPDVIEAAFKSATTTSKTDITDLQWDDGKPKKKSKNEKGEIDG